MTVLDASAVIALLKGEPAAVPVADIIRKPDTDCWIPAPNLAEVIDVLVRRDGRSLDDVLERLDWLAAGGLMTAAVDDTIAGAAGRIRAAHYRRGDAPLSLADCLALATALTLDDALATADTVLREVAGRERVEVIALPHAAGRLPGSGA